MDNETFTLKQASEELGVPTQVLRRICDAGLIRHLRRTRTGYRILTREQMMVLRDFVCLKKAGFSIKDMKKYAKLEEKGDMTILERKAMLETKKRQIWQVIEDAQENIDFIERRIENFDQTLSTDRV